MAGGGTGNWGNYSEQNTNNLASTLGFAPSYFVGSGSGNYAAPILDFLQTQKSTSEATGGASDVGASVGVLGGSGGAVTKIAESAQALQQYIPHIIIATTVLFLGVVMLRKKRKRNK
jgi:hypothetical protein